MAISPDNPSTSDHPSNDETAPADPRAVAERLKGLADRVVDPRDRLRLNNLASAVLGGPSASAWRSLSPPQVFDVDALADDLVQPEPTLRWSDRITIIRNGVIFLPVLVTWAAIAGAVGAYQRLLLARPDQVQLPFLYLWEGGFGGQLSLTLSRVAVIDAILIGLLVALTLVSSLAQEVLPRNQEDRLHAERHQIFSTLSDAELALAVSLPHGTVDTIERLDLVGRTLLSELRDDRSRLRDVEARQVQQSAELKEATAHLSAATGNLGVAVQVLGNIAPRLNDYFEVIAAAQGSMAATQAQLQEATRSMTATVTRVLTDQNDSIQLATRSLAESARTADVSASRLHDFQVAVTDQQGRLLDALIREREGQEHLYGVFANALVAFEESLREAATYSRTAYGMAVDVRDVANTLPIVTKELRDGFGEVVKAQLRAAEALEDAGTRILPPVAASATSDVSAVVVGVSTPNHD